MKTESEVNEDILRITDRIKHLHPELLKYLNEMPVTIPDAAHPVIDVLALESYYISLLALVTDYTLSHAPLCKKP